MEIINPTCLKNLQIIEIVAHWTNKSWSSTSFDLISFHSKLHCFSVNGLENRINPWHKFSSLRADVKFWDSKSDSSSFSVQSAATNGPLEDMLSEMLRAGSDILFIRSRFTDALERLQIFDSGQRCEDSSRLYFWTFFCFSETWVKRSCFDLEKRAFRVLALNWVHHNLEMNTIAVLGYLSIRGVWPYEVWRYRVPQLWFALDDQTNIPALFLLTNQFNKLSLD